MLKNGTFGGKHIEIVYLKDITGVNRIKGRDVFLRNRLLTACVFSLSSRAKAQEFVNALNMVMWPTSAFGPDLRPRIWRHGGWSFNLRGVAPLCQK